MNLTHSVLCLLNEDAKEVSLYCVYFLYDQSENKKFLINKTKTNLNNFNTSIKSEDENESYSNKRIVSFNGIVRTYNSRNCLKQHQLLKKLYFDKINSKF